MQFILVIKNENEYNICYITSLFGVFLEISNFEIPLGPQAVAQWLASWAPNLWTRVQSLGAVLLDRSSILATRAIRLIIVVPACLLGLT